ncbi:MAG: MerR family transcriptional regulator [Chloroflexota bacterium]
MVLGAMKVGELARQSGVSVRALHHYDEVGLLSPAGRTEAGYRLYSREEIARLQQIISLRQMGFSLAEIRQLLTRPDYSLKRVLSMHIGRLREQIAAQTRVCALLETLTAGLEENGATSMEELLHAIMEVRKMEKYYTPEQAEAIKQRADELGEEGLRASQDEWAQLIDDVKAEMAKGTDPTDPRVQALARHWMQLVEGFTGGDPGIHQSLQKMWNEEENIHGYETAEMKVLGEYIGKALAAGQGK